jgi:hypothetical protein
VITLLFLLATVIVPAILSMLPPTGDEIDLQRYTLAALEVFVGLFALLSAVAGKASSGAKLGGVLFALGFIALTLTEEFTTALYSVAIGYRLADTTVYLLLFLCWAVSRPFRGPGYFGIIVLIVFEFAQTYIATGIYNSAGSSASMLIALIDVVLVLATVAFSGLLERRPAMQPVVRVIAMEGPPNGKAQASLTFALIALALNALSQFIPHQIGLAFSFFAIGLLVAAIVVGHLARREIRTTNQRGAGRALAGLLIGYIVLGIDVALLLASALLIGALVTSL